MNTPAQPPHIDLNADLGEGAGADELILPWVSSVNIACGGHAGDAASMRQACAQVAARGLRLGAHPSFEDREHFGRRPLQIEPAVLYSQLCRQIEGLLEAAQVEGVVLHHIKPHGALYNQAAESPELAQALLRCWATLGGRWVLFALAGSPLVSWARQAGLTVWEEGFADRRYTPEGRLRPRSLPGACLEEWNEALEQGLSLALGRPLAETALCLRPRTLCVHGDGPQAARLMQALHQHLRQHGIELA
jgi:UPF0271 protein